MAGKKTFKEYVFNEIWVLLQHMLPDKMYLSLRYYVVFGRKLNWKNPQSFSEKLHWLKLYGYKDIYSSLVDKIVVKSIVSKKIGEKYIIPTLQTWDSAEAIDFDRLPNEFVLKCNHNSGEVFLCRDKSELDEDQVRKRIREMLKEDYFLRARETPYKYIMRKVFAEKLIGGGSKKSLTDYKFYCFDGAVQIILVVQGRDDEGRSFDYFDKKWTHLDACDVGEKNAEVTPKKPMKLEEMIFISEELSMGIPHVRVDLYYEAGCVYFGELTFYDGGGFAVYNEDKWDYIFGQYLTLPYNEKDIRNHSNI